MDFLHPLGELQHAHAHFPKINAPGLKNKELSRDLTRGAALHIVTALEGTTPTTVIII